MRKVLIAGIVAAAQILPAGQPAMAAELHRDRASSSNHVSAFAGARFRVPLGGGRERPQAGLALTSTLRSGSTGELRFAKGAELGLAGGEKVSLKLGGRPVARLGPGREGPDGRKVGASTTKGLLIVGGIVVLTLGGVALLLMSQE